VRVGMVARKHMQTHVCICAATRAVEVASWYLPTYVAFRGERCSAKVAFESAVAVIDPSPRWTPRLGPSTADRSRLSA